MKAFLLILGVIALASLAIVIVYCIKKREVPVIPLAFVSMSIMALGVFLFDTAGGLLFGLLWTLALIGIPALMYNLDEEKLMAHWAVILFVLFPTSGLIIENISHYNDCKEIVASIEVTECGDYNIAPTLYCSECLGECDVFVAEGPIGWNTKCRHCGEDVGHHHTMQYTKAELQHQRETAEYNSRYDFMTMMPQ